jgi:ribosomal protein S18 acetylase RimI-like enzyme
MPDDYLEALSVPERAEMWRNGLAQSAPDRVSRFVVENQDGVVVGFAVVGPRGNDDEAVDGELYVINVDPDSWGTGAGPALHEAALEALADAGFEHAVLWVHPENGRARHFYNSRGWTTNGEEPTESVLGVEVPELQYSMNLR